MLSQLERARKVVADFVPQDPPSNHYVYAYLGKATYDATQYEFIDGLCLASKRIWHLDESQTDCVAYVGEGYNGRIDEHRYHPLVPINSECRIKLYEGVSKDDAQELERLLIAELGCVLDDDKPLGCLANIKYFNNGPWCCKPLEAFVYKAKLSGIDAAVNAATVVNKVSTFAMTADKSVVAEGSMHELGRLFGIHPTHISRCCLNQLRGVWIKQLSRSLYFCKASDYDAYKVQPVTKRAFSKNRLLIAARLDGSDICCGTASDIKHYAFEIKQSQALHAVAQGRQPSAYGWTARYADELDVPVATCGPNLSAFF